MPFAGWMSLRRARNARLPGFGPRRLGSLDLGPISHEHKGAIRQRHWSASRLGAGTFPTSEDDGRMVAPNAEYGPIVLGILLLMLMTLLVARAARKDRREFARFKRFRTTERRKKMYRKWLIHSMIVFGGSAVIVWAFAYRFAPLLRVQIEQLPGVRSTRRAFDEAGPAAAIIIGAIVAVIIVGTVVAVVLVRDSESVATIGDIEALLPRNRAELGFGAALSINAGIVEELLFRLALPALVFGISGNATISVVSSLLIFGVLHLYQGPIGVLASTVIGTFLMALYFATGTILIPIIVHAIIDLRSLVLIPVIVGRVHRVTGPQTQAENGSVIP